MKFSWKNIENWRSWKSTFFWVGHFAFFSPNDKQLGGSYEVSFISALWMVSSKSRKRLHSIYYAHNCKFNKYLIWAVYTKFEKRWPNVRNSIYSLSQGYTTFLQFLDNCSCLHASSNSQSEIQLNKYETAPKFIQ